MAKQPINIGIAVNDGTGDSLRTAFDKTNDNFDELYIAGPIGTSVQISGNTISSATAVSAQYSAITFDNATANIGNIVLSPSGSGIVQMDSHVFLKSYTTAERDAGPTRNGLLIYNSTTNKIQAYANGVWVDLH